MAIDFINKAYIYMRVNVFLPKSKISNLLVIHTHMYKHIVREDRNVWKYY